MSGAELDAHVDRCDGGPPIRRYRPQPSHGSRVGSPLEEVTLHALPGPAGGEPGRALAPGGSAGGEPRTWHLVTRGLTELDTKSSPNREQSGWGFELTLRLEGGGEEPEWAVGLLTNLAAYVWTSQNPFAAGHHLDLGGPMRLKSATALTAAAVVRDPGLGAITTGFGRVEFLQLVGLTADELELCRSWSTEGVMSLLAADDPLLVTCLGRPSLLADRARAAEIARRAERDGSSLTELAVASLRWTRGRGGRALLVLGAGAARALGPALRRELIGPGASFSILSESYVARFTVAEEPAWRLVGNVMEIAVPLSEVEGLAALFDGRTGQGRRPAWPGLRFRVAP